MGVSKEAFLLLENGDCKFPRADFDYGDCSELLTTPALSPCERIKIKVSGGTGWWSVDYSKI